MKAKQLDVIGKITVCKYVVTSIQSFNFPSWCKQHSQFPLCFRQDFNSNPLAPGDSLIRDPTGSFVKHTCFRSAEVLFQDPVPDPGYRAGTAYPDEVSNRDIRGSSFARWSRTTRTYIILDLSLQKGPVRGFKGFTKKPAGAGLNAVKQGPRGSFRENKDGMKLGAGGIKTKE